MINIDENVPIQSYFPRELEFEVNTLVVLLVNVIKISFEIQCNFLLVELTFEVQFAIILEKELGFEVDFDMLVEKELGFEVQFDMLVEKELEIDNFLVK